MMTARDLRDGSSRQFAYWMYKLMRLMEDTGYNDKALATLDLTAYHEYFVDGLTPEVALEEIENP